MFVLLGAVVACVVASAVLLVAMVRRDEPHLGTFGVASLLLAGLLGTIYGALASM